VLTEQFVSLRDEIETMPIDEARAVNDREAPLMFGPLEAVASAEDRIVAGGIRARHYEPLDAAAGTLVYLHGGGWSIGGLESHDGVARFLCARTPCRVLAIDYALAPEHTFPAALEDAWSATRWAARRMPEPLAIGGDSSGGNLAAVVARRARDSDVKVALQLLVYAVFDMRFDSHWMRQYLGGRSADDPDASPGLAADLSGLAPALILSCGLDELKPQADAYTARLQDAGVDVRHIVYPGLIHTSYRMPGVIPEARKMLEDSAAALAAAFA
jgi:acetyl esterase